MSEIKYIEIVVFGLVHGVGFRWFIQKNAQELGIRGYVNNQYDGTVVIKAEGTTSQIDELIKLAKDGPSRSNVSEIKIKELNNCDQFLDFTIR